MIQIIEDDIVTSNIVAALLKRMRYSYCEARTGSEALEQLRTQPIDMVIADMMLPDMNGLDLLREKHGMLHLRDIPVLCCTAQADIETVEAALGLGAIDFVRKPIAVEFFAGRINRAMERAPVRWESWRDMTRRLRFQSRSIQPMLVVADQVLHELDDALAASQAGSTEMASLNSAVTRARGAALSVGAIRTVQQIDKLWKGDATPDDVMHLRSALVIEFAAFQDAMRSRSANVDSAAAGAAAESPHHVTTTPIDESAVNGVGEASPRPDLRLEPNIDAASESGAHAEAEAEPSRQSQPERDQEPLVDAEQAPRVAAAGGM